LSLQIAILKILAGHDSGRATLSSLNRDIAILTASGAEWSARIKRLAARVPFIDIFGNGYVIRDDRGWQITAAGRDFLNSLEAGTQTTCHQPVRRQARMFETQGKARSSANSWSAKQDAGVPF
jgi:hypothetical protein